jgi:preprotein translocase SecE subunit
VGPSFLQVYKRGQGYYTRAGTAVGAGLLILAGGHFVWENFSFDEYPISGMWIRVGLTVAAVGIPAFILYWVVGVNRRSCDFMIATEGEMKKVNWTTKRQLKASTAVVIVVTILMALLLFVVDLAFMHFFSAINVLETEPSIFGGGP